MTDESDSRPPSAGIDAATTDDADRGGDSRRQALRHMGKLAIYTAPALLAMLTAARADPPFCSFC